MFQSRTKHLSLLVKLPCPLLCVSIANRAENNPEVMTSLVHKLGLSPTLAFHDVWSIDDPEMLSFVPRPANALLLVFPITKAYETSRMEEDAHQPEYNGTGSEPVIWYKQTIRNACGLIGVLHAISNGSSRSLIGMVASRPCQADANCGSRTGLRPL